MVNDSVASVIGQHDLGVGGAAVNGLKLSDPVPRWGLDRTFSKREFPPAFAEKFEEVFERSWSCVHSEHAQEINTSRDESGRVWVVFWATGG